MARPKDKPPNPTTLPPVKYLWPAPGPTDFGFLYDAVQKLALTPPYDPATRPWYLDLGWRHFRGRPYLATQPNSSGSAVSVQTSAGTFTLNVNDGSQFVAGQPIVIGSAAPFSTVVIQSIATNVLTVYPFVGQVFPVGTLVQPLWADNYHPGWNMAYAAYAQAISDARQSWATTGFQMLPAAAGNLDTTYTDARSVANVPTGWESLGAATFTASSYNTADFNPFARQGSGVKIVGGAAGIGMRTLASIPVRPGQRLVASCMLQATFGTSGMQFQAVDKNTPSTVLGSLGANTAGQIVSSAANNLYPQSFSFTVPVGTTDIELRIITTTAGGDQAYADDARLTESRQETNTSDRYVIEDPGQRYIVYIGDSWGVGTNHVPTYLQAALEARIGRPLNFLNQSISGQQLPSYISRFATDVLPYSPAYLIVEYGANDISAQRTQSQMEGDIDTMIDLCRVNGIIPIFPGINPYALFLATALQRNDQLRARCDRITL